MLIITDNEILQLYSSLFDPRVFAVYHGPCLFMLVTISSFINRNYRKPVECRCFEQRSPLTIQNYDTHCSDVSSCTIVVWHLLSLLVIVIHCKILFAFIKSRLWFSMWAPVVLYSVSNLNWIWNWPIRLQQLLWASLVFLENFGDFSKTIGPTTLKISLSWSPHQAPPTHMHVYKQIHVLLMLFGFL